MKASQYMYTSWKNAPNHGFSLYSMTDGLSPAECEEISKMMKYTLQPGMPRDPSDDEIANLLPRNVSFFKLSSGRYCLAQAGYVGREYRGFEESGRLGNYLIHAYVIDDVEDIVPMSFVGDDLFRYDLTKEEWTTTRPDPLPIVDIPSVGRMLSPTEIGSFFTPERTEILTKLITAIISANKDGKTVFFNDESKNMPYWYKALSVCLPLNYAGRAAFNTYSLSVAAPMGIPACCKLCISNVSVSLESAIPVTAPSMAEETRKGNVIIDLVRKSFSDVRISKYASVIADKFKTSIFDALGYAKKIDAILAKYSCSIDEAVDINSFMEGRLDSFTSLDHVVSTLKLIGSSADPSMSGSITAFAEKILSGAFAFGDDIASVIKNTVYPVVSPDVKARLLDYVMKSALQSASSKPDKADSVKYVNSLLPCGVETAADYIYSKGLYRAMISADEYQIYYLTSVSLSCYDRLAAAYPGVADNVVCSVLNKYVAAADVPSINKLHEISPGKISAFLLRCLKALIDANKITSITQDMLFYLISKSGACTADVVKALGAAISAWGSSSSFIEKYLSYSNGAIDVDVQLRNIPQLAAFFDQVEVYRFSKSRVTVESLAEYYDSVYSKRPSDTILIPKLDELLRSLSKEERFKKALSVYSKCLSGKETLPEYDKEIVKALYPAVFANDAIKILKVEIKGDAQLRRAILGLMDAVRASLIPTGVSFTVIQCYVDLISSADKVVVEKAKKGELLTAISSNSNALSIFTQEMLPDYLEKVYEAVKANGADAMSFVKAVLPLTTIGATFADALAAAYKSDSPVAAKAAASLAASLLVVVASDNPANTPALKQTYVYFLKAIPKKERMEIYKLSAKITKKNEDLIKCMEIINEVNAETKESFFTKLKNLFKF